MTWALVAIVVAFGVGMFLGTKTSNAHLEHEAHQRGRQLGIRDGLQTAYITAAYELNAPSKGTKRSIVGRAIVRKLRALAEGTGE